MHFLASFIVAFLMETTSARVVSLNACTDQLLIELADRGQIAGVSYFAVDPTMSTYWQEAEGLNLLYGSAEEVIALEPDVILTGTFSTRETKAILRRLGYNVVELTPASSFEDIRANLRLLGTALGKESRAEELIAEMNTRLEAASKDPGKDAPLFANYDVNGWSTGAGTLMADIAATAGYRTLGDALEFQGMRRVNLETLLTARPDVIDLGTQRRDAPALASEALKHPALKILIANSVEADIPGNLTVCGTTRTVEAVEILAAAHDRTSE